MFIHTIFLIRAPQKGERRGSEVDQFTFFALQPEDWSFFARNMYNLVKLLKGLSIVRYIK